MNASQIQFDIDFLHVPISNLYTPLVDCVGLQEKKILLFTYNFFFIILKFKSKNLLYELS